MWRSLLFVPALEERFVAKAATRGADAVVLDLEASIDAGRKDEARGAIGAAIDRLSPDATVTVRINPLWLAAVRDLEVSVVPGVSALHLAQCEGPDQVLAIDGLVSDLERQRGLPQGAIKLVAMIESANALCRAAQIALASPRLLGLTLGVEDYATSMGVTTSAELLRPAVVQLNQAARAAGLASFAIPAGMATFADISALEAEARFARKIGTAGGYAVHPAQVATLNAVFQPTAEELDWATEVSNAADRAAEHGQAVFKVAGQMIDGPLITRARAILEKADRGI